MAHGFSATRDDGPPGYAEASRDAGFAVVLFDYRAAVAWGRRQDVSTRSPRALGFVVQRRATGWLLPRTIPVSRL
jgi:hypothetical protein